MSTLETLDKLTHAWPRTDRVVLGWLFGIGYTALRYQGTGRMEGLEMLQPYLQDCDKDVRRRALDGVRAVFHGAGADALDKLACVTESRDKFIRDLSPLAVGETLVDEPVDVILDVLRPAYTHRSHFIRGLGCRALGIAGEGRGHPELLSILQERIGDPDMFVAHSAINSLGRVFAETGDPRVLGLLGPYTPFPQVERGEGESQRAVHFRWRHVGRCHGEAAPAIARIARQTAAQPRGVELLRRYLHPENVPSKMGFEMLVDQAQGVRAMSWLLEGKPQEALVEMRFVLPRPIVQESGWARALARNVAMWTLPGVFTGSGADGIDAALPLLSEREHPVVRASILSLGVAGRGSCDGRSMEALAPFLTHGNGAVRDAANLGIGLLCHRSARADVHALLRRANMDDRRGAGTSYPLAVGLTYQGSGDEGTAIEVMKLCDLGRKRLGRNAATAVGFIYQGTSNDRAAELLVPYMESSGIAEVAFAADALQLVDFDEKTLESALPRPHGLSDGPGAAWMFARKHFLPTPPKPEY